DFLSNEHGFYSTVECERCEIEFYSYGKDYRRSVNKKYGLRMDKVYREWFEPEKHSPKDNNEVEESTSPDVETELIENNEQLNLF
ncbi:MAG: hypothetical protein ACQERX_05975, partial [Bacillota bacterium]